MLADYLLWSGVVAVMAAVGTWASLAVWHRWIQREEAALRALLDARDREVLQRAEAERRAAEALAASERRHRALTRAGAIVVWQATPDGRIAAIEGWTGFTGGEPDQVLGSTRSWLDAVVVEDRARAAAAWTLALAERAPFDAEFRVAGPDGAPRWCRARAVLVTHDGREEWIGVIEDIDSRRRAEEARLLLAREVNHRAKNMLAVVQAVVRLTRASEPEAFAAAVSARIAALGRAHDLLAQRDWGDVGLDDLVRGELAAYLAPPPRVRIDGPPLRLAAGAVQPLAIALHELAVNAAKYGALSADGEVLVAWRIDEAAGLLRLTWTERGGPPLDAQPTRRGFGTRVIDASVRDQLGGTVGREWLPGGLRCEITMPLTRLHETPALRQSAAE